ncbi:MAG: DUF302 domain-containing protein [Desulfobacterales bacterium]|nr:DUF302 domain-containing protein [Desulfobacterales bacterium]
MKAFGNIIVGMIIGILVVCVAGWVMMPKMMLNEYESPYSVAETVEKIKANALAEGWVVSSVTPLHQSVKKHGNYDLSPVMLINLCQAGHAHKILNDDDTKIVSVMMPCTISVYQKTDGKAYVGAMNAGLMGKMFGGVVAEVMGNVVAKQQKSFIKFVNP